MPLRLALSAAVTAGGAGVVALVVARESPGFSFAGGSVPGTAALLGAGLSTTLCGLAHLVLRPGKPGRPAPGRHRHRVVPG
jgi:hypothetical protein